MGATTISLAGTRPPQPLLIEGQGFKVSVVTVTGSSSYATGGDTCDLQAAGGTIGRGQPLAVFVQGGGGYDAQWLTTKKLQVFVSGGTEVSSTTNLSTITFSLLVFHN